MKKLFIASIIFFLIALGVLGYVLIFKKSSPTVSTQSTGVGGGLPFGSPSGGSINPQGNTITNGNANVGTPNTQGVALARLMKLTNSPVAGATAYIVGSTTLVRYAVKGTGYITEVNLITGTTSELVNTTFSQIYESVWANSGKNVILRTALESSGNVITSYSALLVPSSNSTDTNTQTSFELLGTYLPNDIQSLAVSPDSKKIAYAATTANGGEAIGTANPDGSKAAALFTSSFGEWNIAWPQINTLALTTKPAAGIPGNFYIVNLKTSLMKKVVSAVPGLVATVNPKADRVAYTNDALDLKISIFGGATADTGLQTIADKCAWDQTSSTILYCASPVSLGSNNLPDSWYQGLTTFSDALYQIDTTGATSKTLIADFENSYGQNLDIENPFITSDDKYLIFTNKKDYTLWAFRLGTTQ